MPKTNTSLKKTAPALPASRNWQADHAELLEEFIGWNQRGEIQDLLIIVRKPGGASEFAVSGSAAQDRVIALGLLRLFEQQLFTPGKTKN